MLAVIENATIRQTPQIAHLIRVAFAEYQPVLDPPSAAHRETARSVRSKMAEGGAFVAAVGESMAGCVLWRLESTYVYVGRLAVLPDHRKAGIGYQLLMRVEQEIQQRGLGKIQLAVRIVLAKLIDYYERRGFRIVREGTHKGYTQPTYLVMEKELVQGIEVGGAAAL